MARKKRNGFFQKFAIPSLPDLGMEADTKKSIFIIFIISLGAIALFGLFGGGGVLGVYLNFWLATAFGWGKWIFPVMLVIWGYFLYAEEKYDIRGSNYLGAILFILSLTGLFFLFIEHSQWPTALAKGDGGGYVGLILAGNLYKYTGLAVTWIITLGILVTSILLLFRASLKHIIGREGAAGKISYPFIFILNKLLRREEKTDEDGGEEEESDEEEETNEDDEDSEEKEESDEEEETNEDDEDSEEKEENEEEEEKTTAPAFSKSTIKNEPDIWWKKKTGVKINLPIDLLSGQIGKPKSGDIEANKEIIKRTMENFGIPVEMGEVNVGPTVTQYTFKPAEGIKLAKIGILGNDLALALALHPIRIEAPIPNRSLVGLEVPNKAKATVSLREILESKIYKTRDNNLMLALGKDVSAGNRMNNLGKMPHLLVAGATNTGKSVCLNSIIVSLMYQNNPDDLRFILVDPKRVEMSLYNGIPYLMVPVITDVKNTINALRWCLNEMDRRFDVLKESGVKNIDSYNQKNKIRMPYIVFIIDELADLIVAARRDIETNVIRLSQMARAVGIHLVLATQRPSVDIITGVIKANMPARIAFTVASGVDSKTILDNFGAEKLLGRGDMLFINPEMQKPVRIQGAFVSESEIKKIVRYIKDKAGSFEYVKEITEKQKVSGMGGVGLNTGGDDDDEYFEEAKEMVINMGKASTTFLQRKFGIGYARAAKILDGLEEAGVVGPSNGAKPREIMVTREQYEAIADIGVSGVALHNREEAKAPPEFLESDDEDKDEDENSSDDEEEPDNEDNADEEDNSEDEDDEDIFKEEENEEEPKKQDKNKRTFVNLDDDAKLFSR